MSEHKKVELKINYTPDKLEKLYEAKKIFEQDSNQTVDLEYFIDMLVDAFLSYRAIRGASESELLQNFVSKKTDKSMV
jgi:hypothetical protein